MNAADSSRFFVETKKSKLSNWRTKNLPNSGIREIKSFSSQKNKRKKKTDREAKRWLSTRQLK